MQLLTYGDLSKPKILAIHPMMLDSACMARIMEGLLEDYCIVAPDLSGHGTDQSRFESREKEVSLLCGMLEAAKLTDFAILYGASLGALIGLELLNRKNSGVRAEAMIFESCPLIKDGVFTRRMAHNMLISKRKKAIEQKDRAELLMKNAAGDHFGSVIYQHFFRMDEEELDRIAAACCVKALPGLPPEWQKRMFFDFGTEDFNTKNIRMVKRAYPNAHITLHKGFHHCQYPARLDQNYGTVLTGYLEQVRKAL